MTPHQDGAARRDSINDLDCIECGRWFPTFDRLAKHMYARHGSPTPLSAARLRGVATDKETPIAESIPREEDRDNMAKKTKGSAPRKRSGGGIPAPSADAGSNDFNPFLKASDIGKIGATGKLELTGGGVRVVDGDFGEQIVAEVRFGRSLYDWGITVDSPNHRMLFDKFGKDPKKWRGPVNVVIKESRQRRPYIAVARGR